MVDQLKEKLGQTYTFSDLKSRQLENYKVMRDMPGTLWDMYNDLKKSGFDSLIASVNIKIWQYWRLPIDDDI